MAVDNAALQRMTEYLQQTRNDGPERKGVIRVSSAGDCSRKIGYKLLGFPEERELTLSELVTFQVGHSYHAMLQKWLIAMGWIQDEGWLEVHMKDLALRREGSCDGITERLTPEGFPTLNGSRRVIEIKSITNVAQERYGKESQGAFTRLEKPRDYHLDQANVYADMWNRLVNRYLAGETPEVREVESRFGVLTADDFVTHITMIYVGKDTSEMPLKIFTQPVSEKRMDRLREKFGRIWAHVDQEELPDRDHDPFAGFPPCKFCPYQALCMSAGSEA